MYTRFNGMLQLVGFQTARAPLFTPMNNLRQHGKFGDDIYLVAPFLDPTVKLSWVDDEFDFLSVDEKNTCN